MSSIKKILANVVQSLTASEKAQARSNIGISPAYNTIKDKTMNCVYGYTFFTGADALLAVKDSNAT